MTEWQKLWEKILDDGLEDMIDQTEIQYSARWLMRIKAEGDKLVETINKLRYHITTEGIDENIKKLEAVHELIKTRPKSHINPPLRDSVACTGYDDKAVYDWFKELEEVLGK